MATPTGGYLRYNGPLGKALVANHGHFLRGESKFVDYLTLCAFKNPACAAEGWEVSEKPFSNEADKKTSVNVVNELPRVADAKVLDTKTGSK